jgi:hypothetical protein
VIARMTPANAPISAELGDHVESLGLAETG